MQTFRKWLEAVATTTSSDIGSIINPPNDDRGDDDEEWKFENLVKKYGQAIDNWSKNENNPAIRQITRIIIDRLIGNFSENIYLLKHAGMQGEIGIEFSGVDDPIELAEKLDKEGKPFLYHSDIWKPFNTTPENLVLLMDKGDVWLFVFSFIHKNIGYDKFSKYAKAEVYYRWKKNEQKYRAKMKSLVENLYRMNLRSLEISEPEPNSILWYSKPDRLMSGQIVRIHLYFKYQA